MKRMVCFLLAAWLLTAPALADVIWTPEDDFFEAHYDQCEYLGRSYYANGQAGFVMVFQTPEAAEYVEHYLANGTALYVSFTMEYGGGLWGVVELEDGRTGWVSMEALMLIYDQQSFTEEHGAEFTPYDGSFETLCTSRDQRVILWTYPGSGEISCDFDTLSQDYSPLEPDATWTDGEGRVWGHVGYYMAARGWVCLSDPGNEDLPVTEQTYDLYPVAEPSAEPAQTSGPDSGLLAAGVAAVCAVTAGLLFRMRKRT